MLIFFTLLLINHKNERVKNGIYVEISQIQIDPDLCGPVSYSTPCR
jgi:hypothetical protein